MGIRSEDKKGGQWPNAMVRKWVADIADIEDQHRLETIIRDNASEFKSKDLTEHLKGLGFKNHYSVVYKQWQNGLLDSYIDSLTLHVSSLRW